MTPELAGELLRAGYPLKPYFEKERDTADNEYLAPSLSELIDACGKDFYSLTRGAPNWHALSSNGPTVSSGTTSEEAVARLWLALH